MEFGSIKLIHPVEDPRLFTRGQAKHKKIFKKKKIYDQKVVSNGTKIIYN